MLKYQKHSLTLIVIVGLVLFGSLLAQAADKGKEVSDAAPDFVYEDHDKRDPLWKLIGPRGSILSYDKDVQATDLLLEGVMAEPGGESVAIINGNIVKVGDKIGLFVITNIQTNEVTLEKGQETFTLKLKKEE